MIDVLKYVEGKRPKKFKVADIGVGYNAASGEADSVFINYWIGRKRKQGEQYVDLGYDLNKDGSLFSELLKNATPMQIALEKGKDSFLAAVDSAYLNDCKDDSSGKFVC